MKCPLCAREMTSMATSPDPSLNELSGKQETVYYCERHGVMNKPTDLKERVDQIAKRI